MGETAKISYVDQSHAKLDPEKSIYEIIGDGQEQFELGGQIVNARAYLARFNFSGGDQSKKVGILSGGERNRLHLAMALKGGRKRLAFGRANERFGHQHPACTGRGLGSFCGVCGDNFARSMVP